MLSSVYVLYGSETGQGEAISQQIYNRLKRFIPDCCTQCLDKVAKDLSHQVTVTIFCVLLGKILQKLANSHIISYVNAHGV